MPKSPFYWYYLVGAKRVLIYGTITLWFAGIIGALILGLVTQLGAPTPGELNRAKETRHVRWQLEQLKVDQKSVLNDQVRESEAREAALLTQNEQIAEEFSDLQADKTALTLAADRLQKEKEVIAQHSTTLQTQMEKTADELADLKADKTALTLAADRLLKEVMEQLLSLDAAE